MPHAWIYLAGHAVMATDKALECKVNTAFLKPWIFHVA